MQNNSATAKEERSEPIYMGNTLRWAHPGKRLVVVSTSALGLQQCDRQRRKVRARGGGYFVAPIGNRQLRCSPTSASQPVTAAQGSLVSMHPQPAHQFGPVQWVHISVLYFLSLEFGDISYMMINTEIQITKITSWAIN